MFEISLSWVYGLGQIAVYCAVIVSVLVILSKIDLPYRKAGKCQTCQDSYEKGVRIGYRTAKQERGEN